jgi:hypothetical protein
MNYLCPVIGIFMRCAYLLGNGECSVVYLSDFNGASKHGAARSVGIKR